MEFLDAKALHESPEIASANELQLLMMPVWVGPGAVTPVVVVLVMLVVTAGAAIPTQYHSCAHKDVWQF